MKPPPVTILVDGEGKLSFLAHEKKLREGAVTHLAALPGGMVGGRASVAIVGRMRDGSTAFVQCSLRIMLQALAMWRAHYGPEADGVQQPEPNDLTRERMNAALLLMLIRDRDGSEATFDVARLNAIMQDLSDGIEVEFSKDNTAITVRASRST